MLTNSTKSLTRMMIVARHQSRRAYDRFMTDERGLTVSAVILIGFLVVATVTFAGIAATKMSLAGSEVTKVSFN